MLPPVAPLRTPQHIERCAFDCCKKKAVFLLARIGMVFPKADKSILYHIFRMVHAGFTAGEKNLARVQE